MSRPLPADQAHRDAVVRERARNVVVDAGAGTGKTTLVVRRVVELIAPGDDSVEAVPLERIAAVTFTRKAAGELRLRVREGILRALADKAASATRRERLFVAMGVVDQAHIGTIHGFADRLLRMYPVESRLSPAYEIVEDVSELHRETFERLLVGVERGTLAADLAGTGAEDRAHEAAVVVHAAIDSGVLLETRELTWGELPGLDALLAGLVDHRDVPPRDSAATPFDADGFARAADRFIARAKLSHGDLAGSVWVDRTAKKLGELKMQTDVAGIYRQFVKKIEGGADDLQKKRDFGADEAGYDAWKAFTGEERAKHEPLTLGKDMRNTLDAWLARKLVRLAPVVVALYEKVKARRHVVDPIDLLLRLRDLLRDHLAVRAELQGLFRHVFVDEFQDTDPLQAEIMLFLAEEGAKAKDAWEAKIGRGKLTIVGDPKQSIYRFRRADVATYDRVRRKLAETDPLEATLSVNFRSTPGLVDWYNDRFARVLGVSPAGARFDVRTGAVFHAPLEAAPDAKSDAEHDVEVIPLDAVAEGVDAARDLEAKALARYVEWLVDGSGRTVTDPLTEEVRPIRYGDVAVLALVTTNLPRLAREFDALDVPYATSGGKLFLDDGQIRQFLLALRAIADREDGPAQAALLRPPFFAIDLADLAVAKAAKDGETSDERVLRVRAARAIVTDLRRTRATRSPGATARDLLERTALGRTVGAGPNGAQRLQRLREVCIEIDALASRAGLDFDGATDVMRGWADGPPAIDPPRPVDDAAVRVSTVHQAKGLEFPVVILWDSRGDWDTRAFTPAWAVERETRAWAVKMTSGPDWEEPSGTGFKDREKEYRDQERKRLLYVAATRAREKLVIATSSEDGETKHVHAVLAAPSANAAVEKRVKRWGMYRGEGQEEGQEMAWPAPRERIACVNLPDPDRTSLDEQIARTWASAIGEAGRGRFRRVAASAQAKGKKGDSREEVETEEDREPPKGVARRAGRFGPVFGDTVHRAIGLALERKMDARAAIARAAREMGLTANVEDAVGDVERTLECLRREKLVEDGAYRIEYAVAGEEKGADGAGLLVGGSIDLLCAGEQGVDVIDFKTDRAPEDGEKVEETHAAYVEQVGTYGRMIERSGIDAGKPIRRGLLFTEKGRVWWV